VRGKNVIVLVCVVFAAFGVYVVLSVATQAWLRPQTINGSANTHLPDLLSLDLITRFGVLAASGAALCRLVDSPVPLKWCLGLGLVFAAVNLLPWLFFWPRMSHSAIAPSFYLFNVANVIGHVVAPVVGGYFVKRLRYGAK
jgi:hypothetical protein